MSPSHSHRRLPLQAVLVIPFVLQIIIMMPEMDGFETCQQLKKNPHTATIPVIFMTALADAQSKISALNLGAVDYVTKPFQEEEVLARVKTQLRLARLNQHLEQEVAKKTQQLQSSQLQLVQHEKMSTLGNSIAGIAHEINNPLGFLTGNLTILQENIQDVLEHISLCHQQDINSAIADHAETIDLDYLLEDIPKTLDSMATGIERLRDISVSLRLFARADQETQILFDIKDALESTLLILNYRLKGNQQRPEIAVVKNYGELPEVHCFPGQLNQVFINIIVNAIDAFEEASRGKLYQEIEANPNTITITTSVIEEQVQIQIQDNGCGMKPETVERIFEQGFTTKEVGKGTGLGMAIAHQIITEKHDGKITCASELRQGTTFTLSLPLTV